MAGQTALRSPAKERRLRFVISGPCDCALKGDAHLLTRVVENLLDNALRHSPLGGCVTVEWERTPAAYHFADGDSGLGIAVVDCRTSAISSISCIAATPRVTAAPEAQG